MDDPGSRQAWPIAARPNRGGNDQWEHGDRPCSGVCRTWTSICGGDVVRKYA